MQWFPRSSNWEKVTNRWQKLTWSFWSEWLERKRTNYQQSWHDITNVIWFRYVYGYFVLVIICRYEVVLTIYGGISFGAFGLATIQRNLFMQLSCCILQHIFYVILFNAVQQKLCSVSKCFVILNCLVSIDKTFTCFFTSTIIITQILIIV